MGKRGKTPNPLAGLGQRGRFVVMPRACCNTALIQKSTALYSTREGCCHAIRSHSNFPAQMCPPKSYESSSLKVSTGPSAQFLRQSYSFRSPSRNRPFLVARCPSLTTRSMFSKYRLPKIMSSSNNMKDASALG